MAREIKMDELLQKQRVMSDKANALASEKDIDKIQRITAELEQEGRELEELAREQRARVKKLTGVDMPSVVIADEAGVLSKAMPYTKPRDIEQLAINEALKQASMQNADGKMRAAVDDAIREIEQSGYGEVLAELEKL